MKTAKSKTKLGSRRTPRQRAPRPKTMQDMADAHCADCGHDHTALVLNSRCHTGAPTIAVLHPDQGVLEVLCYVCKEPVAAFQVSAVDVPEAEPETEPS